MEGSMDWNQIILATGVPLFLGVIFTFMGIVFRKVSDSGGVIFEKGRAIKSLDPEIASKLDQAFKDSNFRNQGNRGPVPDMRLFRTLGTIFLAIGVLMFGVSAMIFYAMSKAGNAA